MTHLSKYLLLSNPFTSFSPDILHRNNKCRKLSSLEQLYISIKIPRTARQRKIMSFFQFLHYPCHIFAILTKVDPYGFSAILQPFLLPRTKNLPFNPFPSLYYLPFPSPKFSQHVSFGLLRRVFPIPCINTHHLVMRLKYELKRIYLVQMRNKILLAQ